MRHQIQESTIILVYKSLFVAVYAITTYGLTYATHLNRIKTIMNRALRVSKFSKGQINANHLYQKLECKKFSESLRLQTLKYIFKAKNVLSAFAASHFVELNTSRKSRYSDNFMLSILNIKSKFLRNTVFYNSVKSFNDLSLVSRQVESLNTFLSLIVN